MTSVGGGCTKDAFFNSGLVSSITTLRGDLRIGVSSTKGDLGDIEDAPFLMIVIGGRLMVIDDDSSLPFLSDVIDDE